MSPERRPKMKAYQTLLFVICFMIPLLANAGTPSEDPVVAQIQNEFKNAPPITEAALRLGKAWGNCKAYTAAQGDFRVETYDDDNGPIPFIFSKFNGLFTINDTVSGNLTYAIQNGELLGHYDDTSYSTIKVTADGYLIEEDATPAQGHRFALNDEVGGPIVAPAVGTYARAHSMLVFGYVVCLPMNP